MTTFRGFNACTCLAKWLPVYESELRRRKIIGRKTSLRIYQLIGGAAASGGTHSRGGAFDLLDMPGNDDVWLARQMGADATWSRPYNWDRRGGMAHMHGVLTGCPHNGPARYQIDDVRRGLNGLANHAKDTGPRPLSGRTWEEGIKWAKGKAKPPKPSVAWHSCAFLNTHGDDGSTGTKTYFNRLPQMVVDVTKGKPDVIALCEVTAEQEKVTVKTMKNAGYKLVGYEHRLALFALPAVKVGAVSFATYKRQNKGAIEGILRARLTVNGSRVNYGVTHLDYRPGFDAGRVAQMKEGIAAMRRFGLTLLPSWKSRTVILGDFNSETWVLDKALEPAGFKDVGAGADIDFITVGDERPIGKVGHSSTQSDHPIIRAEIRKFA